MPVLTEKKVARPSTGNGFFLWSVVLLVMSGLCFASWLGSFYVVGHPENPKCYRILKKFKRVDPPKRFAVTEAPKGEFLLAKVLLERFGKLGKLELANENALLMRNYLTNFRESGRRVPYVAGRFQIVQSFDLRRRDWFPAGAVAVAESESFQQVLIEFVFPAAPENVAAIRDAVTMGTDVNLQRAQDLWAIVHVERHGDGRMEFTVVPLPYGGWQLKHGQGSFRLRSPEELSHDSGFELNLAAGLPIVRDPRLAAALAQHRDYRRKILARSGDDQAALAGPELVRLDPAATAAADDEKTASAPQPPATPPNPQAAQAARPVPVPAPAMPLPPRPAIIGAMPSVVAVPAPAPEPAAPAPEEPPKAARAVSTTEASALVDHFSANEPVLLAGEFVVTGVLGRRVAMRTIESLRDPNADPTKPGEAALIVVEFPADGPMPEKDATLTRGSDQGFVVRNVIRGRNGQITIIANEHADD